MHGKTKINQIAVASSLYTYLAIIKVQCHHAFYKLITVQQLAE